MPRSDENGRELQAVLSYILNRPISAKELLDALGTSRSTLYNRIREDDFPNAEECRLLAEFYGLNPLELQFTFGLIHQGHLDDLWSAHQQMQGKADAGGVATAARRKGSKGGAPSLKNLARRTNMPPL